MGNYIAADLRRIFRKQSFLGAVGAFAGCFAILVFIYFNPSLTAEMYSSKMTSFMSFFPMVVGLLTFLSGYADDFKCRSMQVAIGYGMPRGRILFAKLLESAVLLLATAAVMAVLLTAAPLLLGLAPTPQQMASLVLTAGGRASAGAGVRCYVRCGGVPDAECTGRHDPLCAALVQNRLYHCDPAFRAGLPARYRR